MHRCYRVLEKHESQWSAAHSHMISSMRKESYGIKEELDEFATAHEARAHAEAFAGIACGLLLRARVRAVACAVAQKGALVREPVLHARVPLLLRPPRLQARVFLHL